jgi:hypothetical protein
MEMGQQAAVSEKPLEIARNKLCMKYGKISCILGCKHFGGATDDNQVICKHVKGCSREIILALKQGRYFERSPQLATPLPGSVLAQIAREARIKAHNTYTE